MIVRSRRKQRGALRTHDSAGEAPPQTDTRERWVQPRQRLSQSRWRTGEDTTKGRPRQLLRRDVRTSITGMRSGDLAASNISRFHSRPQERRLNTGSRLYRAMLAPAAAPPGRPRVFPQAEKTNPGGSNRPVDAYTSETDCGKTRGSSGMTLRALPVPPPGPLIERILGGWHTSQQSFSLAGYRLGKCPGLLVWSHQAMDPSSCRLGTITARCLVVTAWKRN